MDIDDLQCGLCTRLYSPTGDTIPRLLPENGYTYCTACLQDMIDQAENEDYFVCPDDEETQIARKPLATDYPKNFSLLRLAEKARKTQAGAKSEMSASVVTNNTMMRASVLSQGVKPQEPEILVGDLCQVHKRKIEIICIDCKERICSNCALFGQHKPHDIRMEQDVLDEINIRTECLMEMYQIVEQTASEKPDEVLVEQISTQFKKKSQDLRTTLTNKFKEMRSKLKVQEQIAEAILKKNLNYMENEIKNLKSVDYTTFNDAEKWLKNAKVKLDNFQANNDNPHFIAFDMLANAKQSQTDEFMGGEDNLLMDEESKNIDIIVHGEKIADILGKVKTINPNLLANQLNQLSLKFDEKLIESVGNFAKCIAIEGVEISQEELEAIQEAADAGRDAQDDHALVNSIQDEVFVPPAAKKRQTVQPAAIGNLQLDMEALTIHNKKQEQKPVQKQVQQAVVVKAAPIVTKQPEVIKPPVFQEMPQEVVQPQNEYYQETTNNELDPEFLMEVENYLKECMENNEASIDMSDTLIQDHGAKMVAAAASLCDDLVEMRLQQCGITDEGAIELFTELKSLKKLKILDISFNAITERSLDHLQALLDSNKNLIVSMQMNAIKNKFAIRKMQAYEQAGRLKLSNS